MDLSKYVSELQARNSTLETAVRLLAKYLETQNPETFHDVIGGQIRAQAGPEKSEDQLVENRALAALVGVRLS